MTSPRQEARQAGQIKYLGSPCPHCGQAVRYTNSTKCVECEGARTGARPRTEPRPFRASRFAKSKRHWPSYRQAQAQE